MKKTISLMLSTFLAAQCIVGCPAIAVEANSNLVTESTESTESFSFDFVVQLYNESDDSNIPGVDLKIVEYDAGYDKKAEPKDNKAFEIRTLAEWNTSDSNPVFYNFNDLDVSHYYVVQCEQLPENYCFGSMKTSYFYVAREGSELKAFSKSVNHDIINQIYHIGLLNEPAYENWNFPKTETADFKLGFYDYIDYVTDVRNANNIPDLDTEVVSVYKEGDEFRIGDTIDTTYTDDGEICFTRDAYFESINDMVYFGVKVNNIPDNYAKYYDELWHMDDYLDDYKIVGFNGYDTSLNYTSHDFVLRKDGDPIYTTTSTTETTTTTTTAEIDYATVFDFDSSPMRIGESRKIKYYNAGTKETGNSISIYPSNDSIDFKWYEGNDFFIVTAIKAGDVKIEVNQAGAYLGGQLELTILDEEFENNCKIVFDDENISVHGNETKEFKYSLIGADNVVFDSNDKYHITLDNKTENGKGTLTVKSQHCPSGMNTLFCELKNGNGTAYVVEVPLEILFKCPNCGKLVHDEYVAKTASGHDVCLECYNAGVYVGTTTSTATTTTTSTDVNPESDKVGDANCDGQLNMADAVFIMQCIANPDKYTFTEQGRKNADADKSGDITNMDALTIQKFKLRLIDSLT